MAIRFKQLSKTSTEWTSLNPTLLEGEIGFEKDTNKLKIGDGVSNWNTLEYTIGDNSSEIDTSNFVDLTSEQTISGIKEFSNVIKSTRRRWVSDTSEFLITSDSFDFGFDNLLIDTIQTQTGAFSGEFSSGNIVYGDFIIPLKDLRDNVLIGREMTISDTSNSSRYNIVIGNLSNYNTSGDPSVYGSRNIVISTQQNNGQDSVVSGEASIAIGYNTRITGDNSIQLGTGTNNTSNTFQVWDYQLLDGNTGLIPNERLNLGTKKYLHRITLNLSDQASGSPPNKTAVIHLDYYSEQETAYTSPNFATLALTNSIGCSGYYIDADVSLTEKNFVYEIALPQSNEFILNNNVSITIQSTGSSITDEVIGYVLS